MSLVEVAPGARYSYPFDQEKRDESMSTMAVGVLLLVVGVVLALATTLDSFGWLMAVGGVVIIIVAAVLPHVRSRR